MKRFSLEGSPLSFAVVGYPVAQSVSPAMHQAAFAAYGSPHTYGRVALPPEGWEDFFHKTPHAGLNITIPHKERAFQSASWPSSLVRELKAANVLSRLEEGWAAENTDALALKTLFLEDYGPFMEGPVLLLGTGGAARAAFWALKEGGAREIWVRARDREKARSFLASFEGSLELQGTALGWEDPFSLEPVSLVVQATPVGMADPGESPLEEKVFPKGRGGKAILDLVVHRQMPELGRVALAQDWHYEDGLRMLALQAALSWEVWFGIRGPLPIMRRAAEKALGREGW
ncbi:MAG: shikimate dehydrogenase [Bacillota bacterium]|nr:shikimate dehydrogenase [Bacillota bacterium]